jgi:hypothetical protein
VEFAAPVNRVASLAVEAGGTARVVASAVAGGKTLVTHVLTITDSGRLDLANNRLVVDYDGVNSPLANVANLIKLGFGVAGARWQGPGIVSGAAGADAAMGIGYAEASDVLRLSGNQSADFGGEMVDATSVLVRFTRLGDANLDGRVDFSDFQRLERGFGRTGQRWAGGDFDYDGLVTRADFGLLYANFGRGIDPGGAAAMDVLAPGLPEPGWAAVSVVGFTLIGVKRGNRRVKMENL